VGRGLREFKESLSGDNRRDDEDLAELQSTSTTRSTTTVE
jgi:Sec-independent protein translocase protein TatA